MLTELNFFKYDYKLLKPLIKTEYFDIASFEDIACMKLISVAQRTAERDYIDLYFILQKMSLKELMPMCQEKYPMFNESNILRGLNYIGDVEREEKK